LCGRLLGTNNRKRKHDEQEEQYAGGDLNGDGKADILIFSQN
jgi:hypothetical protein